MKKLHLEKFLLVLLIIPLFGCCSLFSNNCIVVNTNVYEIEEKEDIDFDVMEHRVFYKNNGKWVGKNIQILLLKFDKRNIYNLQYPFDVSAIVSNDSISQEIDPASIRAAIIDEKATIVIDPDVLLPPKCHLQIQAISENNQKHIFEYDFVITQETETHSRTKISLFFNLSEAEKKDYK